MPSGFEVKLEIPELPATLAAFNAQPALRATMINEALRDSGRILLPAIKAETPIGKSEGGKATHGGGRSLAASTNGRVVGEQLLITQNARSNQGVSYGIFVREGTRPHDIAAREAKSLHFYIGGKEIFVTHVHHPGNKANPYQERAYEKVRGEVESVVNGINERTAANITAAGSK